jgi:uncharacterized protein (DUF2147 family)
MPGTSLSPKKPTKMGWIRQLGYACGVFILASNIFVLPAGAAPENGLAGNWARDDGSVQMVIAPCGGALCATNTAVKDPSGAERVGDRLVLKLTPLSSSAFQGQAYDVRRQRTYKMTITVQGTTLRTTACVLLGIVCKSADWTRVK